MGYFCHLRGDVDTMMTPHASQGGHRTILTCKIMYIHTCQYIYIYIYIYVKLIYYDHSNKNVEHANLRITKI